LSLSTWLQDHPRTLEWSYRFTVVCANLFYPLVRMLGFKRANRWLSPMEGWVKGKMFGCKMCGQCELSTTGMTCPMTCPKKLRNGACGGVRSNGHEGSSSWINMLTKEDKKAPKGWADLPHNPVIERKLLKSADDK
jgi:hypothetical protein